MRIKFQIRNVAKGLHIAVCFYEEYKIPIAVACYMPN